MHISDLVAPIVVPLDYRGVAADSSVATDSSVDGGPPVSHRCVLFAFDRYQYGEVHNPELSALFNFARTTTCSSVG